MIWNSQLHQHCPGRAIWRCTRTVEGMQYHGPYASTSVVIPGSTWRGFVRIITFTYQNTSQFYSDRNCFPGKANIIVDCWWLFRKKDSISESSSSQFKKWTSMTRGKWHILTMFYPAGKSSDAGSCRIRWNPKSVPIEIFRIHKPDCLTRVSI